MAPVPADRIPVIVGVGEVTDRPADPREGKEPVALMAEALRLAEADAGGAGRLLAALDSLDIVNEISWPYRDPVGRLCAALGTRPARAAYGVVGGQTPVRYLHEAALRIARGESVVAAVCGAEAEHTVQRAKRAGLRLPWEGHDPDHRPIRGADYQRPVARRLGVATPPTVYPFYENATLAAWGQTPAQARAESAALWSALSAVAAGQPNAWLGRLHAPAEIATPSPRNRPIAWPYLKLMVANPAVNQGAALLLTSLARARATGIPDRSLVHVWGGAAADEPRDYLARDDYRHSGAMEAVLEAAAAVGGGGAAGFDVVELYNRFPRVPKTARRTLGLGPEVVPTVVGGLTFFGAPLNNYMGHAVVAMVRRLREAAGGGVGLLYGQGEYVTKHHALVVASRPREDGEMAQGYSVQAVADARRGQVPELVADCAGRAFVETFTVLFDREAAPTHGVVIARAEGGGARLMARVPAEDTESLGLLLDEKRSPIGSVGTVRVGRDGMLEWRCA
jgi:acetyl-CoA C-acetyltransferase